jgi:Tol biopolymer transport system component
VISQAGIGIKLPALESLAIGILLAGLLVIVSPAVASSPPGPRLATVELIQTKGSERDEKASSPFVALTTMGPLGGKQRHLRKGKLEEGAPGQVVPFPFYGPTWFGDGSAIAFLGFKGKSVGFFLISADGKELEPLKGVLGPVFSADGRTMAFSRTRSRHRHPGRPDSHDYSSTTTWVVDLATGALTRLTPWRDGLSNVPTSFSPDGSVLAMTEEDDKLDGPRVVLTHLDGSGSQVLFTQATEATISPDGSRIAFVGYLNPTHIEAEENQDYEIGELYVANIDGSGLKRVTRNDDEIETSPSWDPSGERIAYVEMKASTSFVPGLDFLFPVGNAIEEVNADGSCKTTVRSSPKVAYYGVAWEPGTGREAGRIDCRSASNSAAES